MTLGARNMFGFPERLYQEERKNFRVRDTIPIKWVAQSGGSGAGRVCDISETGALIEADSNRPILDGTVISLKQQVDDKGEFLPRQAKVVWSKRKGFLKKGVVVGVEFTDPSAEASDLLKERIESRMKALRSTNRILSVITSVLFVIMLVLIGIVLFQRSSVFKTVERSNTLMLTSIEKQAELYQELLGQFRALQSVYVQLQVEYVTTKGLLAETEGLLQEAQRQYAQAQGELSLLRNSLTETKIQMLDNNVKALVFQRDTLLTELKSLQEEIDALASENPEGFETQTALYQSRVDAIDLRMQNMKYDALLAKIADQQKQIVTSKKRIRDLKIEAALVKRETQQKKDEIALAQGNRGFMTKDGRSSIEKPTGDVVGQKVNVNVSVF